MSVTRDERTIRQEIEDLLRRQSEAWNHGDLDTFTAVYADDAAFVSSSGLTRGRPQVLERYRRRYPDRAAMGRLTLEVLELRTISGVETSMVGDAQPGRVHGASAVGRWRLSYPEDAAREEAEGLTLLVFQRAGDGWKIVQDASM